MLEIMSPAASHNTFLRYHGHCGVNPIGHIWNNVERKVKALNSASTPIKDLGFDQWSFKTTVGGYQSEERWQLVYNFSIIVISLVF